MFLVGTQRNRIRWTALGAKGAADAVVGDPVVDKGLAPTRRAAARNMGLILFTEMGQR